MFSLGQWWCPRHIVPRLHSRLILHFCHRTIASSSDVRTPCEIKIIASSNVCHDQNSHNGRPTIVYVTVLFSTVWHLDNPTIELFNLISYDVYTFEDEATTSKHVVQDTVCKMYHKVLAVSVSNALTFFYQLEEMFNK